MTFLLLICLKPSILFLGNPRKYWYYLPVILVGYLADRIVANTSFRLVAGRGPQGSEKTVSDMVQNLANDSTNPEQEFYIQMALKINRAVGVQHIKLKGV